MRFRRSVAGAVTAVVAVALGVVAAAVADDGGDRDRAGPPPPTRPGVARPVLDWATHEPVDLGGGWTITDTEGDGPFVDVRLDGRLVGFLEYTSHLFEGTLDEHVVEFVRAIGDDRAKAPIEGYRFAPDAAAHADGADGPIVRYGFTGTLRDGSPSERTYQWAGVRDGRLVLVTAAANDPGGLFPPEGREFTTVELESVIDRLDRLVRASGLPDPA